MNTHVRFAEPLVLTISELVAEECRAQGFRHVCEVSKPENLLDITGQLRSEYSFFENFVILVPQGAEHLRDTIALNVGDERCKWAYLPDEPQNIPVAIAAAKRMWLDEVSRLDDIPDPGPSGSLHHGISRTRPAWAPDLHAGIHADRRPLWLRQVDLPAPAFGEPVAASRLALSAHVVRGEGQTPDSSAIFAGTFSRKSRTPGPTKIGSRQTASSIGPVFFFAVSAVRFWTLIGSLIASSTQFASTASVSWRSIPSTRSTINCPRA